MKNVQPDMNVAKQRRKFDQRITEAPDDEHRRYLTSLRDEFDASVAAGMPRPASEFLPMYEEEFDL